MNGDTQAPEAVGPDYIAHRRPEVLSVEIEGEAIIYDESQEVAHLLSPTAAIVWEMLDGRSRIADVAIDIAEAFGVDTEQILRDVLNLVRDFARLGLLEQCPATAAAIS